MRYVISIVFLALLLAGAGVWVSSHGAPQVQRSSDVADGRICAEPLTYRLAEVDPRFGISKEELRNVIAEAAAVWEEIAPRRLFAYDPNGALGIYLRYDERQGTWEKRQEAERALEQARGRYDRLVQRHENREHELQTRRAVHESKVERVERMTVHHNQRVRAWNDGAIERTSRLADQLEEEARQIARQQQRVEESLAEVERARERFNRTVREMNAKVEALNQQIDAFNQQFARGGGYNKGLYEQKTAEGRLVRSITVFQFHDRDDLRQVLAHELGHALGIRHVDDPAALMYYRMTDENRARTRLAAADRQALREVCGW